MVQMKIYWLLGKIKAINLKLQAHMNMNNVIYYQILVGPSQLQLVPSNIFGFLFCNRYSHCPLTQNE